MAGKLKLAEPTSTTELRLLEITELSELIPCWSELVENWFLINWKKLLAPCEVLSELSTKGTIVLILLAPGLPATLKNPAAKVVEILDKPPLTETVEIPRENTVDSELSPWETEYVDKLDITDDKLDMPAGLLRFE